MRILGAVVFVAMSAGTAFADVSLFLYPRAVSRDGGVSVSDIALIDGDREAASRVGAIVIAGNALQDGYLDRRELSVLLAGEWPGAVRIYGSGVRVVSDAAPAGSRGGAVIRKGKTVRFRVTNGGIAVELTGTALDDGAVGDTIPVRVRGTSVARGAVVNDKVVEMEL